MAMDRATTLSFTMALLVLSYGDVTDTTSIFYAVYDHNQQLNVVMVQLGSTLIHFFFPQAGSGQMQL